MSRTSRRVHLGLVATVTALLLVLGTALSPTGAVASGVLDEPTSGPSDQPTSEPSEGPTDGPTDEPTGEPTGEPTDGPTDSPVDTPTDSPTEIAIDPTASPSEESPVELTAPVPAPGEAVIWGLVRKAGDPRRLGNVRVTAVPVGVDDGEPEATSLTYGGYGYRNGVFALYVPPGTYTVRVAAPEGSQRGDLEIAAVTVTADQVFFKGELTLPYLPGVIVRVFDLQGRRVDDASVRASVRRGGVVASDRTVDGKAVLTGLASGSRYRIDVVRNGFQAASSKVVLNGLRAKKTFYLRRAPEAAEGQSVIWGVVKSAGQRRLPQGIRVQAFDLGDGPDAEAAATALTYGGYGFRGGVFALYVPAGDYRVVVTAPTGVGRENLVLEQVTVGPDEVDNLGYVSLPRPPGIFVRAVEASSSRRLSDASVRVTDLQGGVTDLVTGPTGTAFLPGPFERGTYEISVSKAGYDDYFSSIRVRNGRGKRIAYLQPAPLAAPGQSVIWGLVGAVGSRRYVADATVQAFSVEGDEPVATSRTYGGYGYRNGVYALYVPPGEYVVRVTPPRRLDRESVEIGPVEVGADQVLNAGYSRLNYPRGIRVKVEDVRRLPLTDAEVTIQGPDGAPLMLTTDARGQAFFRGSLPIGIYDIAVSKDGYMSALFSRRHGRDGRTSITFRLQATPVAAPGQSVIWGVVKRDRSRRYVADALVQAFPADGGPAVASSLTYGGYGYRNGVFALYVPPGDYTVTVTPPEDVTGEPLDVGPVSVAADEVTFLSSIRLSFEMVSALTPPVVSPSTGLVEGDLVTVQPATYSDETLVDSRSYEWFAEYPDTCPGRRDCSYEYRFARGPATEVALPSWTEGARIVVVETARSARGTRLAKTASESTSVVGDAPELVATSSPSFPGIPTQGVAVTPVGVAWNVAPDAVRYRWTVDGTAVPAGDIRLSSDGRTFTPTARDVGSWLSVELMATKDGYTPGYAYAYASRIKGADERTRVLRVELTRADGPDTGDADDVVTDASISLCGRNDCYSTTVRNGAFEAEVPSSQDGLRYQLSAYPYAADLLGTSRSVTVEDGDTPKVVTVRLEGVRRTPPSVTFPPSTPTRGDGAGSVPMGFIGSPLTPFTARGCTPVDSPSWTVTFANGSEPMTGRVRADDVEAETGTDPATVSYTVRIPELTSSGHATITTNFTCGTPISFTIYIDPSGYVTDQFGRTIAGAEVTLLRSAPGASNFSLVADRDASVMDPAVNDRNPSTTDATGFFRWDVTEGDYRVSVTRASSGGSACAVVTTPTMSVPPIRVDLLIRTECGSATAPTPLSAPAVTGAREVGRVLSVTAGTWAHGIRQTGVQWLRNGDPIEGATGNQYTLVQADAGQQVTARVTAQRPDYVQENGSGALVSFTPFTAAATGGGAVFAANPGGGGGGGGGGTPAPAISNTAKPTVSGVAKVGGKLTAEPGTWSTTGLTFAYQWRRGGVPIVGATGAEYAPVVADLDTLVTVTVTASKAGSVPGTATSDPVTIGKGAAPENLSKPLVTGEPEVGESLTVSDGTWSGEGLTFAYQWLRDDEVIEGATAATYVVTEEDLGALLTADVTASRVGYEDGTVRASGITVPEPVDPAPSTTKATLLGTKVEQGERGELRVKVTSEGESVPTGTLVISAGSKTTEVELTESDMGKVRVTLPKLKPGKHVVKVEYSGDELTEGSSDRAGVLKVKEKSKRDKKGKGGAKRTGAGRPTAIL